MARLEPMYSQGHDKVGLSYKTAAALAIILLILTMGTLIWTSLQERESTSFLTGINLLYVSLCVFGVLAPIWFWCEFYFLFRKYGNAAAFDVFKHNQQVSGAIWLGTLVLIGGFLSNNKPPDTKSEELSRKVAALERQVKQLHAQLATQMNKPNQRPPHRP